MLLLNLAGLALVALNGAASAARPAHAMVSVFSVAVDSGAEVTLTTDQLTKYLAVKKELQAFWKAEQATTTEFLKAAQSSITNRTVNFGSTSAPAQVYDYPNLVKRNTKLAAIFTKNNLAPEQFAPLHLAVLQAVGRLTLVDAKQETLPASSTVIGKNIELVKPRRAELEAVGVVIQVRSNGGGDDINP